MTTIGYLGPEGSFSELACQHYLADNELGYLPKAFSSFFQLFEALDCSDCNYIIVPVENSIGGEVGMTLDLLIKYNKAKISAEVKIKIEHVFLGLIGTKKEDVIDIISHPQPLLQCREYIQKNYPEITESNLHEFPSTSKAAKDFVGNNIRGLTSREKAAIIGSKELANQYPELCILDSDIEDNASNITQFYVLSFEGSKPTGQDKTTIIFTMEKDKPGGLYHFLGAFAKHNINLTRVFSRPTKSEFGDYIFLIDFIGHQCDDTVKGVLEEIRSSCSFFRCLGSYKEDTL